MQTQTRRGSFGIRSAKACRIAALALVLGFGTIADEAAAFGLSEPGAAIGVDRPATRTPAQHRYAPVSHAGGGGGALANRR